MLFIFSFAGTQICASSGGPNCKRWCSKSPRLVLKIASAGAQNRLGWCRLVLRFALPLVVLIASAGARNRLGWCSKSPRLVLKIASAGAQNRLRWCSKSPRLVLKFVLPLVLFFHVLCGRITSESFVHYVRCSRNYAIFSMV